jgi:hypothetical protein
MLKPFVVILSICFFAIVFCVEEKIFTAEELIKFNGEDVS